MLKVENVTLSFDGLLAINNVSLTVKENRISGLIGPNGAGKTTFFNLIDGVYTPDKGSITFNGNRIDGKKPYQINKAGISRTYQVINLFKKMNLVENVMVGMHSNLQSNVFSSMLRTRAQRSEEKEALERAYDWLEFVNLKDKAKNLAGSLSYGEQRLLEIVRGLASNPKLILLDEPAAGMNSREKEMLHDLLQRILDKKVSILMIEHDMKLMMGVAEYIYVLNYGQKLAEGKPNEIQNNQKVIEAYLGGE